MAGLEYFAGIDWGSQTHQVCIVDSEGTVLGERAFRHDGAGLSEMADWLVATADAEPHVIGIAIEVPHGPVVETMMERGFALHSLNPKQLDRFRDRFSPAGAKDDRRDAHTLGDGLRTDRHAFRRLDASAPEIVELRAWSRIADDLTCERTRLANRAREQLWRYYPQFLKVESDLTKVWARDLWSLVPTPAKARRVRLKTLAALLKRHRVRRIDAEAVRETLREPAVSVAAGTTEAAIAHLEVVFSQLALVTKRSGKSVIVVRRLAAHNRLQNAVYHWAGSAIQHDAVSRAKYTALRARGHGHARALRSVADRLLAVACAMLENQTLFAPDHPGRRHAA